VDAFDCGCKLGHISLIAHMVHDESLMSMSPPCRADIGRDGYLKVNLCRIQSSCLTHCRNEMDTLLHMMQNGTTSH
jgi:hypothetical protein